MNIPSSALSRRSFLLTTAGAAAGAVVANAADAPPAPTGPFKLDPLPYAFDALEPHLDAKTMEIHHDKHHQAYVTKLNEAVTGLQGIGDVKALISDVSKVPEKVQMAVRNHGGGHFNHTLFWSLMAKPGTAAAHAGVFRLPDVDAGGCGVEVRCAARPVDGAANADVAAALAAALGVPKRALELVGGGKDRRKTFAVAAAAAAGAGLNAATLAARLDALPLA